MCPAQSFADQLAGSPAGFFWQAAGLASQLTEPLSAYTAVGVSFTVNALVSLNRERVWWWQGWSEWFSFVSNASCLGNSRCHQVATVYGCGYLNRSAICFNRHHIQLQTSRWEMKGTVWSIWERLSGSYWPRRKKNIDMACSQGAPDVYGADSPWSLLLIPKGKYFWVCPPLSWIGGK